MNHNMSFKHLAIALGVVAVGVLVLTSFGLPLATLVPVAVIALCPVMMIVMMLMMSKHEHHQDSSEHQHTAGRL
jgi:xanthine/uracil/vitamin C permease (AzgA family)